MGPQHFLQMATVVRRLAGGVLRARATPAAPGRLWTSAASSAVPPTRRRPWLGGLRPQSSSAASSSSSRDTSAPLSDSILPNELRKFADRGREWWDAHGVFRPLHAFNPVRVKV